MTPSDFAMYRTQVTTIIKAFEQHARRPGNAYSTFAAKVLSEVFLTAGRLMEDFRLVYKSELDAEKAKQ